MAETDLVKELEKKYGKGVFVDANFILEDKRDIISVSPRVDIGLSGGMPEGYIAMFSGKPKQGKTSTIIQICVNAQKMGKSVYWLDVENRLSQKNLKVTGLDMSKFHVVHSTEDTILTAQDYLNIAEKILKNNKKCVLVIDSASALCAESELIEDITGTSRSASPKLLAAFCRRIVPIIAVRKHLVCITQHLIANTSGYGPAFMEDGGNKIQHAQDIKMRIKTTEKWTDGDGKQVGLIITWEIVTSALGGPCSDIKSYFRFDHGLDATYELMLLACDFGVITKGGSWFTCEFLPDKPKVQGEEKLYQFLVSNPEYIEILNKKIKEFM